MNEWEKKEKFQEKSCFFVFPYRLYSVTYGYVHNCGCVSLSVCQGNVYYCPNLKQHTKILISLEIRDYCFT